jgi:hypothetical protein
MTTTVDLASIVIRLPPRDDPPWTKGPAVTDPAQTLNAALPANPTDHGPIAVPADTVRQVLGELVRLRKAVVNQTDGGE